MTERVGSKEARLLFNDDNITEWNNMLDKYALAIGCVADSKHKKELVTIDKFIMIEWPEAVNCREPRHMTLLELSDFMKWKLTRGKARPLQKLVESNSNESVVAASSSAFARLAINDWEGAISSITRLKGIGVATASAILAPLSPDLCPFMADEVIEAATSCKRDYTLKIYRAVREALVSKAVTLGPNWNAEMVGKALWVKAMAQVYPAISCATESTAENINNKDIAELEVKHNKKKRKLDP